MPLTEDLRGDVVPAEGRDEDNDDLRPFPPQHRGHVEESASGIRTSRRTTSGKPRDQPLDTGATVALPAHLETRRLGDDGGRRSTEGVLVVDDEDAAGFGGGSHENDRPRISPGCRWCRHHCCPRYMRTAATRRWVCSPTGMSSENRVDVLQLLAGSRAAGPRCPRSTHRWRPGPAPRSPARSAGSAGSRRAVGGHEPIDDLGSIDEPPAATLCRAATSWSTSATRPGAGSRGHGCRQPSGSGQLGSAYWESTTTRGRVGAAELGRGADAPSECDGGIRISVTTTSGLPGPPRRGVRGGCRRCEPSRLTGVRPAASSDPAGAGGCPASRTCNGATPPCQGTWSARAGGSVNSPPDRSTHRRIGQLPRRSARVAGRHPLVS